MMIRAEDCVAASVNHPRTLRRGSRAAASGSEAHLTFTVTVPLWLKDCAVALTVSV